MVVVAGAGTIVVVVEAERVVAVTVMMLVGGQVGVVTDVDSVSTVPLLLVAATVNEDDVMDVAAELVEAVETDEALLGLQGDRFLRGCGCVGDGLPGRKTKEVLAMPVVTVAVETVDLGIGKPCVKFFAAVQTYCATVTVIVTSVEHVLSRGDKARVAGMRQKYTNFEEKYMVDGFQFK